jgi:hypothetical protein
MDIPHLPRLRMKASNSLSLLKPRPAKGATICFGQSMEIGQILRLIRVSSVQSADKTMSSDGIQYSFSIVGGSVNDLVFHLVVLESIVLSVQLLKTLCFCFVGFLKFPVLLVYLRIFCLRIFQSVSIIPQV